MHRTLIAFGIGWAVGLSSMADDELVRLPGQGEVKPIASLQALGADRLVPGGGLLLSFDADQDGRVTTAEVADGIPVAFAAADADEDGFLTPLEQIAWADRLPTRDASLSNPARFDPNLDRRVTFDEFSGVVLQFAEGYADEVSGDVIVADLRSKGPRSEEDEEAADQRPVDARNAPQRRRPQRSSLF
ncbi:MAG: hypothetical protein AAGJ29_05360 [Pseudomonadota bacterium]